MLSSMKLRRVPSLCAALLALSAPLSACAPDNAAPAPAAADAPSASHGASSFIVRFKAPHPIARAQALDAAGRCEEAERLARETLAARADLAGLCFDRFTIGGAEIVLKSCTPLAQTDLAAFELAWVARFAAMDGVEYAEPNRLAAIDACP
jgi:hypothetical protein